MALFARLQLLPYFERQRIHHMYFFNQNMSLPCLPDGICLQTFSKNASSTYSHDNESLTHIGPHAACIILFASRFPEVT